MEGIATAVPVADAVIGHAATTLRRTPARVAPAIDVRRRHILLTAAAVALDALCVGAAYALADVLNRSRLPESVPALPDGPWGYATAALWLPVLAFYGLYDRSRLGAPSEEARRLFHAVAVSVGLVMAASFAFEIEIARGWIAAVWLAGLLTMAAGRLAQRHLVGALQARGVLGTAVLIVGTNSEARGIARSLIRQRALGHCPVAFAATEPSPFQTVDGLPVLAGSLDELPAAVASSGASSVIVAGTAIDASELSGVYRSLQPLDIDIRVSAALPEVAASRVVVEPLDGVAVLLVRRPQLSHAQAQLKRVVDVVGSIALLAITAPLLVAIALAVRVSSGRSVIFRQVRVGEGGRPFVIHKFRTMVPDAEIRLDEVVQLNEADGLLFKVADDPRVTRVGKILRRWGLDELPQLWDVLRGGMSLVGPRPPLPHEAARYDEWVKGRLKVKPGITGLWQVNGRHELSFADYVRYDLFYVENWSLALDLYCIARTIPALVGRRGAY